MQESYSKPISDFLKYEKDIRKKYKIALENIDLLDKSTQDLLHQMELGEYKDSVKVVPQLRKIRKARRIYKDFIETVEPFIDLMQTQEYTRAINKLSSDVLGKVRKEEKAKTNRKYYPRVISELPFLIKFNEEG